MKCALNLHPLSTGSLDTRGANLLEKLFVKPVNNHLPWRSIHRDWPGGLCSGCSCRFDDSSAGKPGTFLILSFSPFLLVAPHSAQGWHLKNYNFAELADKRNTGICKQKPLLFWSVCGTFHTNDRRETVTTCRRKEQKVTSFTEAQ